MFETIGKLITFAFWAAAIFLFVGGIICCIKQIFSGSGFEKFLAILAIGLSVFAFIRVYAWLDSILWSMLISGIILSTLGLGGSGEETDKAPRTRSGPSVADAIIDTYCEYELTKAAVKDAIRESKE